MYWDPMRGILILADLRLMGISFHAVIVFGMGKKKKFDDISDFILFFFLKKNPVR